MIAVPGFGSRVAFEMNTASNAGFSKVTVELAP